MQPRLIPVDAADAAWLRMDHPENRMVIVAVMVFDAPMAVADFRRLVDDRLMRFDRFRRRVVSEGARLQWETDPEFDLDHHVMRANLSEGAGEQDLQDYVGDLMSAPLSVSRPPWEFQVVERFSTGSAVIARLHHGIADGIALIRVLLAMADGESPDDTPAETTGPRLSGPLESAAGAVRAVAAAAETVVEETLGMLTEPDRVFNRARQGLGIVSALGKFALVGSDSPTPFREPLTTTKRVAWSRIADVADVKRLSKHLGGTINDVLLTALAGGIRRFLASRGTVPPETEVRAVVPVNLRPPDDPLRLGNRFGLVLLALPVGLEDPLARFREVQTRMDRIKRSMEPVVALGILQTIGPAPRLVQDAVVRVLSSSSSAVMTNVPGPREKIAFAGRTLQEMMFWVPRAGSIGLGISILSYAGDVLVGFSVDAAHLSDPAALVRGFEAEYLEMLAHAPAPG